MMLKVGELARHTGLTVRTLHHYDEIGLLKPTGRSESGYRLYSRADVARLHGVQALRHLGLRLQDIAGMLDGQGTSPALIIEQQMRLLDQQISQAGELRGRLGLLQASLSHGDEPDMASWLESLALMATYGKYFSAAELKIILGNWKLIEPQWMPLLEGVRALMDRGLAADAPEVQPLAQRWMTMMLRWMEGNFDLIDRWSDMYDKEPSSHHGKGAPRPDMVEFIRRAIDLRMTLLCRYVALEEIRAFRYIPETEWRQLGGTVEGLIAQGAPPHGAAARGAVRQWLDLLDRLVNHQPGVRDKLMAAHAAEPLLQAGASLAAAHRAYLRAGLDHHRA